MRTSINVADNRKRVTELVEAGYSETFSKLIFTSNKYDLAIAVASEPDLSMDMKAWIIFKD